MDALPIELKRKIADGCSLATLANLQIASKDWAKACRGVGAKFRKRTFRELYESERDEIREYVAKNVYVEDAYCYYKYIRFRVTGTPNYVVNWFSRYGESPEECVRRLWRESKAEIASMVFSEAVTCLMHRNYVTVPAGIVVPDGVEMRFDLKDGVRDALMLGEREGGLEVEVKVPILGYEKTRTARFTLDSTIEDAHAAAWSLVDKTAFRRRSARLAKPKRTFTQCMCDVDMRKIVAEVA